MYDTKWNVPKSQVSEGVKVFVDAAYNEYSNMDGQITVDEEPWQIRVEFFNGLPDSAFKHLENMAQDVFGVESYKVATDGTELRLSL